MSEISVPINAPGQSKENKKNFGIQLLPDIAFLRQLSIQGRLRFNTVGGGTLTITPNNGETFFMYSILVTAGAIGSTTTIVNDGQTRASFISIAGSSITFPIFDSLVGDGAKTITVTETASTSKAVFGWSENTSRIRDVTI